jgi:glycosyltransferase involved in cell wall biosynthesis
MTDDVKIAFVAPFPPPYGGMGVRFERLTALLSERGYRCRKIRLAWIDGHGLLKLVRRAGAFLASGWRVVRTDAPLIHCVTGSIGNFYALSIVLLAARLSRRWVILSVGGGQWASAAKTGSWPMRASVRALLSLADRIIPCNQSLKDALAGFGVDPRRVTLISNALPDEIGERIHEALPRDFELFCDQHDPVLITVGAMQRHYGLLDVLTAFEQVRVRRPAAGLAVFVKKGACSGFSSEIASRIQGRNLSDAVVIFESVPWVVSAMSRAHVLIRATTVTEGDSRAVREALAVGLPVVASDVGYRPSNVILYKAGHPDHLVRALEGALAASSGRTPYTEPEGAENLRKYEHLYRDLLQIRPLAL